VRRGAREPRNEVRGAPEERGAASERSERAGDEVGGLT